VRSIVMLLGVALAAAAHGAEPQTLAEDSWVCATPEAYDEAIASERKGQDPLALEVELRARCIRMTSERLEDVMAPFVAVVDRTGDKARVSFIIEVYERGATGAEAGIPQPRGGLNRQMKYSGWTAAANLRER
jgi:DNA mismatch repair protein MutH